jgi:uncharacterized protein YcnI
MSYDHAIGGHMRRSGFFAFMFALVAGVASAHIMVSPPQSKPGVTQNYELRVHNESKVATTGVDLEVPDGITVLEITTPTAGTVETTKAGTRITAIKWKVDVAPSKYVALKFSAKNPDAATEVHWNAHQHMADGTLVDWTDKPGAKQKASVTKIAAATDK